MPQTTYTYSNSVDFPDGLVPGQLYGEILLDFLITTPIVSVNDVPGDDVDIVFADALSAPELTELNTLVANYVPALSNGISSSGYITIDSSLADSNAITISASDAAGGIDINAGTGGIAIDTTNSLSLDAGAASNFTTSVGNLELRATAALVNIDGGSGINIGSLAEAQPINIGIPAAARTITIGNMTGTSQTDLRAGTGGFNLDVANGGGISLDSTGASSNWTLVTNGDAQDLTIALTGANNSSIIIDSSGTGADAIRLNSTGGFDVDSAGNWDMDITGTINLATGSNAGGAITLDAAFNNGGIVLSSGTQGIAINSNGGLIGIGHWSGGDIQIGTAAVARSLTIGNITSTTSVAINSGTGGISIGGNSSTGEIHIGNTAIAKTLIIGNNTGGSRIFNRWGSGGNINHQSAHTALANSGATLTVANLITQILTMTPTTDRTLTLPDAADIVSGISGIAVDDCIDFYVINSGSGLGDPSVIISAGTGGTEVGYMTVDPRVGNLVLFRNSGTGHFRLRMTNVTASSEAYTIYRI